MVKRRGNRNIKRWIFGIVLSVLSITMACGQNAGTNQEESEGKEKSTMEITELKVQNLENPIGIQTTNPVFSWKLVSEEKGSSQTAYRIVAASSESNLINGIYDKWDTGKVMSSKNYGIIYEGEEVASMERIYWTVMVWDNHDKETSFAEGAFYEIGLLAADDWKGRWITKSEEEILYPLLGREEGQKEQGSVLVHNFAQTTTKQVRINVSASGPAALGEYQDGNLGGVIFRVQLMEIELYHKGEKVELPSKSRVIAPNNFEYGSQWNANALIDGSEYQGYTSQAAAKNTYAEPIRVTLAFPTEVTFDEIRIICRTDSSSTEQNVCPNYPKFYTIEVKNGNEYQTVVNNETDLCPKIESATEHSSAPILSKEFRVDTEKKVSSARLYISGLGLFEAHMNGVTLGEGTFFHPGESDVRDTIYYCTYDITELMQEENAVSVLLGNGQYANYRIHRQYGRYYKTDDARSITEAEGMFGDVKCIAQVVITYEDGTTQVIGTDETWSYIESPITENSWYGGEDYDATLEIDGWDDISPAIPRAQWGNAVLVDTEDVPTGTLLGMEFEPIRIQESDTITEESITVTKIKEENGLATYLVDMGQNHAGVPEIAIKSSVKGQIIRMYPAEVNTFNGYEKHINQESCTQSASRNGDLIYDTYITKGAGEETYHPRFCYHGYRYLEVTVPADITIDSSCFKGYILRTDNAKNGSFECSDEVLNQINALTERSIESNMYSTFTDCPQIEKLGWLETPGLMFYSMSHTYDISSWIPKIIRDMTDSQYANGRIAAIAPEYFKIGGLYEDLNWNGSIIFTAWQCYEAYGNAGIFSETNYAAMKAYMEYLEHHVAENHLIKRGQMGEWGEMTSYGTTPVILVETTAYYRLANCMRQIAEVTGNTEDAAHYLELAENIREAFHANKECYNETHLYGNGTQSGYGCVLYSGIVREEHIEETVERLVKAIEKTDYHLTSGEVGLKQVFCSLAEHGRSDVVYKMVTNDTMPSYKYFLTKGLTALPEYWNFEDLWWGMARSRNHAMMGHVKEWFTKYLAGISLADVGYDIVNLKPSVIDSVDWVKGSVDTVHGLVGSEYQIGEDGALLWKVSLPVGVSANVYVPLLREDQVILLDGKEVSAERTEDGRYQLLDEAIVAGEYVLEVK